MDAEIAIDEPTASANDTNYIAATFTGGRAWHFDK
jgi:hypothetical protein